MSFEFSKRKALEKTGLAKGLIKVRHNSEKLGRSRVFSFFLKEKLPYNQIFQSGRATAPLFYLYKLSFRQDDSCKMANFRRK